MNLYDLHSDPKSLDHHAEAYETIPALFWSKHKDNKAELKKREAAIAKSLWHAYKYAVGVLKGPFPKGEAVIAKDPWFAINYAKSVLKGPFPKAEAVIAENPEYAAWYAKHILKKDFYLDGKLIARAN